MLTEDGAVVHQDSGWLLLERPAQPAAPAPKLLPPEVADEALGPWALVPAPDSAVNYAEVREALQELRERHAADRKATRVQLERARVSGVRMVAMRKRIEQDALKRRWPPSS